MDGSTRPLQCLSCFLGSCAAPGSAGLPLWPWQLGTGPEGHSVAGGLWSAGPSLPLPSPSLQNKSRFDARRSPYRSQPGLGADPARQEEAMPLGEESPDALVELLRDWHSPWALPPGCTPQDQHLRETAVLAPEVLRGSNIFQVLRSLRIVGKGVSTVQSHPSVGWETKPLCWEGKHLEERTPSPSQGLHRCHPYSWARATTCPPQRVVLICVTHM